MTYRFGRISKAWLRKTAVPINPDERRYGVVPDLPETYGSLGYAPMGIGSMDQAIQRGHRYGIIDPDWDRHGQTCGTTHHCGPGEICESNRCKKVLRTSSPKTRRRRMRKKRRRRKGKKR